MRAYSRGLVGSKPQQQKNHRLPKGATRNRKVVGNHLRWDSCARVVDWQGGKEICW